MTEDPLVAVDADEEEATALLDAVDDAAQEATVGTATPTLC